MDQELVVSNQFMSGMGIKLKKKKATRLVKNITSWEETSEDLFERPCHNPQVASVVEHDRPTSTTKAQKVKTARRTRRSKICGGFADLLNSFEERTEYSPRQEDAAEVTETLAIQASAPNEQSCTVSLAVESEASSSRRSSGLARTFGFFSSDEEADSRMGALSKTKTLDTLLRAGIDKKCAGRHSIFSNDEDFSLNDCFFQSTGSLGASSSSADSCKDLGEQCDGVLHSDGDLETLESARSRGSRGRTAGTPSSGCTWGTSS